MSRTILFSLTMTASAYIFSMLFFSPTFAQTGEDSFVYGDALPDAPELAKRGKYKVGVRTLDFINKGQLDILNVKDGVVPTYDRPLKVEVWYPAQLALGEKERIAYDEVMGTFNDPKRPLIPFSFAGRAKRDAAVLSNENSFPLIIISHGYVGSRFLMTYLTENLASKGYVVVALDHTESTFRDANAFQSTLLNRSKDVLFVLNQMTALAKPNQSVWSGLLDVNRTALIGYSMGGYGVLNVAGAGYSDTACQIFAGMTEGTNALEELSAKHKNLNPNTDPRIKAVVAFAPWGMERGIWDNFGLEGLKVPTFFVAGSQDDISGYEKGIKAIFDGAVNADRYLLTYENARHNVAPNPPPAESLRLGLHIDEYYRYAEPAWDQRRINNINQHFLTAFLGIHLKQEKLEQYLDLKILSDEESWFGFLPRTVTGLELLQEKKQ